MRAIPRGEPRRTDSPDEIAEIRATVKLGRDVDVDVDAG